MSEKNLSRPSQYTRKKIQNYSYGLSDQIGKGYSSQVYRGRNDELDLPVAVKVIDMKMLKSQINKQLLQSQIEILKRMNNYPNILKLHEVYTTKNNTYIITELCQVDLSKKIKNKLSEGQAIKLMKQLLYGYSYIYKESIVHRDLKPANLLLTTDHLLKIADFGFAVDAKEVTKPSKYNVGSPLYMAPQSLKKNQYSFQSDIWSIGVIFFEMLTTQTPWRAKNEKELIKKIQQEKIQSILMKKDFSANVKEFITRLLTVDKNLRITPQEMINFSLGYQEYAPILTEKKLNVTFKYQTVNSNIATPNNNKKKIHVDNNISNNRSDKKLLTINLNSEDYHEPNLIKDNMQDHIKQPIKKEEKKNISKILIAEVHFCRFLFKLLIRIKQSMCMGILAIQPSVLQIKSVFESYSKIIKNKLYQIIQFQEHNFLMIKEESYQQYKDSSDFKKLIKISKEYLERYSKELSEYWNEPAMMLNCDWKYLYDQSSTNLLIYYLKNNLELIISTPKQKHLRRHSSNDNDESSIISKYSKDIIILDYLMTSRQLLDILRENPNDYQRFARKSRIEEIVEGATANIDYQLYQKIIDRATILLQCQIKPIKNQNKCR